MSAGLAETILAAFKGRADQIAVGFTGRDGRPGFEPAPTTDARRLAGVRDQHLAGVKPLGFYILTDKNQTWTACIDIDNKDGKNPEWRAQTENAAAALVSMEIKPLVELSQSGNGAHVWILFRYAIDAWIPRDFLRRLVSEHHIGKVEIFPKQDRLGADGYGNLVRYPLWNQSAFVDVDGLEGWEALDPIEALTGAQRYDGADLMEAAAKRGLGELIEPKHRERPAAGVCDNGDRAPHDGDILRDLPLAMEALRSLGPARRDAYDDWIKVGLALHAVDSSGGMLRAWDAWSKGSPNYTPDGCAKAWAGFDRGNRGELNLGSLIAWGKEDSGGAAVAETMRKYPPRAVADKPAAPRVECGGDPEWPDVELDAGDPAPAEFPIDVLPSRLQHWVMANAASLQTPVDFFAVGALAAASIAALKKVELDCNPARPGLHIEHPAIYTLIGANSSAKKSPAAKIIAAPIYDYMEAANHAFKKDTAAVKPKIQELKAKIETIVKAIKTGKATEDSASLMRDYEEQIERLTPKRPPPLDVNDATPEALIMAMQDHDGRAGFIDSEGVFLQLFTGLYGDKVNADLLKRAYTADGGHGYRIGRGEFQVSKPLIAVLAFTQPSVVEDLGAIKQLKDQGVLARFIISLPQSNSGFRKFDYLEAARNAPKNWVREAYEKTIASILALPIPRDQHDRPAPVRLKLTPEGAALGDAFINELEPHLAPGGSLVYLDDFAGKIQGLAYRIALMLHLLDRADGELGLDWQEAVPPETIAGGIEIARYALAHQIAAYRLMFGGPGADSPSNPKSPQGKMFAAIRAVDADSGDGGAAMAEVERKVRHHAELKKEARERALEALRRGGYIRVETAQKQGAGRPARIVRVNPKLPAP